MKNCKQSDMKIYPPTRIQRQQQCHASATATLRIHNFIELAYNHTHTQTYGRLENAILLVKYYMYARRAGDLAHRARTIGRVIFDWNELGWVTLQYDSI